MGVHSGIAMGTIGRELRMASSAIGCTQASQGGEHLITSPSAQEEDGEWVLVHAVSDEVADGSRMLAGIGPIGTRAGGTELTGDGEQRGPCSFNVVDDSRIELAIE